MGILTLDGSCWIRNNTTLRNIASGTHTSSLEHGASGGGGCPVVVVVVAVVAVVYCLLLLADLQHFDELVQVLDDALSGEKHGNYITECKWCRVMTSSCDYSPCHVIQRLLQRG